MRLVFPHPGKHFSDAIALLLACRQDNYEASGLYYALNTFNLEVFDDINDLCDAIPEDQCANITSIEIDACNVGLMFKLI
jgi:hypothetical protein